MNLHKFRAVALVALACTLQVAPAMAAQLTIDRIFAAPDLSGETLRGARISPDGRLVTYLKGGDTHKDRLDLWAYDITARRHRMLVDSTRLVTDDKPMSDVEAARRERQRISALSGIVSYSFSSDSRRLLVPLGGDLYVYDLQAAPAKAVQRLTDTPSYETDARLSPHGNYVSFIRDQNLWIVDLRTGVERAITHDGAGLVSYGTAEFIAQEEMDRDTGYWWSPDERQIAYTRVDETRVAEVERFEVQAARVDIVHQRYPATGAANALVQLFVQNLDGGVREIDLGADTDIYLARVNWFPDSKALAVQRQSRDQKALDLLHADPATGATRMLITERSDRWVELTNELTFLPEKSQFIWASDRTGYRHLYLYDYAGRLQRSLTQGEWMVVGDGGEPAISGVDDKLGILYFTSTQASVLERHLYQLSLNSRGEPQQVTRGQGWHSIRMAQDSSMYLDTFSTQDQPQSLSLRDARGALLAELAPNRLDAKHPYAPFLAQHGRSQYGMLTAADGQRLNYQMLTPPDMQPGRKYPAIVHVYGGPGAGQYVTRSWGGQWTLLRQLFVNRGYVVFMLDNRGTQARGTRFETAIHHRMGTIEVDDQVLGAKFLAGQAFVDPRRIGIFGWSYGGYLSLLTAIRAPQQFAAAVSGAPVTDWRLYDTHYTERYMGTPAQNAAGYDASSVLLQAGQLQRPMLLIHGMADDNVLFTHSTALMKLWQEQRIPFELMTYPGGKHGLIRNADSGPHALGAIVDFFDRRLALAR
ncbi:MAG: S9 family peptidase [Steroidobacteraceae bacterium]